MNLRDVLRDTLPINSIESGYQILDETIPMPWSCRFRGIGADQRVICSLSYVVGAVGSDSQSWATRELIGTSELDAFLRVWRSIGGNTSPHIPRHDVESVPPVAPQQVQRQAPPSMGDVAGGLVYDGPVPWGNDSHADVAPAGVPDPPGVPSWYDEPVKGWLKKKYGEQLTWRNAVEMELQSPDARDNPLGYMRWCIEREENRPREPKFESFRRGFVSKLKGVLIYHAKLTEQSSPDEDTPF